VLELNQVVKDRDSAFREVHRAVNFKRSVRNGESTLKERETRNSMVLTRG